MKHLQNIRQNNFQHIVAPPFEAVDSLEWWSEEYLRTAVTTSESSRKVQRRDLRLFIQYLISEEKTDNCSGWTPRLSRGFLQSLRNTINENSKRQWSDKTVTRVISHLKTFAKWVDKHNPFALGNPMEKIKLPSISTGLEIERAITPSERRKILDAADMLLNNGGKSKDRTRYNNKERPVRKGYRPYRNRAIVYTLIETGMRRSAISKLNLDDVNLQKRTLTVKEKGGGTHTYQISREGLQAIQDYFRSERNQDAAHWQTNALFLPSFSSAKAKGRLHISMINEIWNAICLVARVEGKTPHCARHAMGKHIIEKTGNIAAVQKQLGHKNAVYSMQYARITADELKVVLDER